MLRDGIETDGKGNKCRSRYQSHVDEKAHGKDDLDPRTTKNAAVVDNVQHVRVFSPVLNEIVGSVEGKRAKNNDAENAREETKDIQC